MFNNALVLDKLGEQPNGTPRHGPTPRKRVRSSPCLPQGLPSTGTQTDHSRSPTSTSHFIRVEVLERDAEEEVPKLMIRQLLHSPSPPPESETSEEAPSTPTTPTTPTTPRSPIFGKNPFFRRPGGPKSPSAGLWQGSEPQVCTPSEQNNLSRLTPAVMGGIQSD